MTNSIDLADWDRLPEWTSLTIGEVATVLRVSQSHVRNAIDSGRLAAVLLEGRGRGTYRVTKQAVVQYQEGSEVQPRIERRVRTTKQVGGGFFKHLRPTWLPGASRQQDARALQQGENIARSYG